VEEAENDDMRERSRGVYIPWGNEAEIFIIAILGGICHFRGETIFFYFRGEANV